VEIAMSQWWANIPSFERIFWYFAIPFSLVFSIQLILTFIGIDGHDTAPDMHDGFDLNHSSDFLTGFHLFTLRNFIIFFTGFGWAGIFAVHAGFNQFFTVFFAFLTGLILMITVAGMFFVMSKLTQSGNIHLTNAINASGRVYLPIPGGRSGLGQIQLTVQGSVREVNAMTDEAAIPTGAPVTVTSVLNDEILIVKRSN
jgi:hypothetical protein